jgi:hypothetical protein
VYGPRGRLVVAALVLDQDVHGDARGEDRAQLGGGVGGHVAVAGGRSRSIGAVCGHGAQPLTVAPKRQFGVSGVTSAQGRRRPQLSVSAGQAAQDTHLCWQDHAGPHPGHTGEAGWGTRPGCWVRRGHRPASGASCDWPNRSVRARGRDADRAGKPEDDRARAAVGQVAWSPASRISDSTLL